MVKWRWWWLWLLLYSVILHSRADSLRSHVILHEWLAYFIVCLFLNQGGHLTQVKASTSTTDSAQKSYRHQRASKLPRRWCHLHTSEWRSPGPSAPLWSAPAPQGTHAAAWWTHHTYRAWPCRSQICALCSGHSLKHYHLCAGQSCLAVFRSFTITLTLVTGSCVQVSHV